MSFDGLITKSVISELNHSIIGSKVNKVFEPNKNEIYLNLYNNGNNYTLLLSTDPVFCRIGLTNFHKPNPQSAFNFCMLLRKYLVGSKIISIMNYDLERTIEINFECYNELNDIVIRKIYISIMSRQSNIILTNENNIIIDSLKHFDNSLPTHVFEFAKNEKKSFLKINTFDSFFPLIDSNLNISTNFSNTFIGFGKKTIIPYLNILNINNEKYTINDLNSLYCYLKNLLNNIDNEKVSLIFDINDFYLIDSNKNKLNNLDINYSIDKFYYKKEEDYIFSSTKNNLYKIVLTCSKKLSKKLDNINNKLEECKNIDTYKLYGELLTSNLYKIQKNNNLESIILENYYNNNIKTEIPLDKSISVQKNIDKYFKKYNKLKNTLEIVKTQKQEVLKEIDYIESIFFSIEKASTYNDLNEIYEEININIIKKKHPKATNTSNKKTNNAPSIEYINIGEYKVFYGKNNTQNSYLTLKFSSRNDLWFHVQKAHGSHVVLKVNHPDEEIPDDVLFECAKIAKENSKASSSTNVPVDYCKVKFIKKIPGSKPGMVNYTNYKTIIVK